MISPIQIDSPEQIQRELQSLQMQQHGLRPLPPIQPARDALMDATARHSVDEKYLVQRQAAERVLAERLAKHDQFAELTQQIAALEVRLADAQQRVRVEMAERADKRLAAAQQEYRQSQLQTGRAFRSLLQQNARSSNTPGAGVVKIDYRLHLPALTPASWSGSTGEAMSAGHLPFEAEER